MNIEELKQIRNKNVQQQNMISYLEMKECAEGFRVEFDKHPWLNELLTVKNQNIEGGILFECHDIFEQAGTEWNGTWLTNDKQFFEFTVIADRNTEKLIDVDEWERVTPRISEHCKGVGKSKAFIALELLDDLFNKQNKA